MPAAIPQFFGAEAQANAAKDASAAQLALTQQQMQKLEDAGHTANGILYDAVPGVQDNMAQGYQQAGDFATKGLGQQRSDILNGGNLAAGAINQGTGGALDALYGGAEQGVGYVNSGLKSGVGAIGDRTDRSGAMLDKAGGLYGDLQMDPSYQFRFDQGEKALRSMQAAQGGRFGGAAQKALVDYGQNMASTEYQNAANRRLQEYGAAQGADSQSLQAQSQLAGLYGNAGSQAANMAYGTGQNAASAYGQSADRLAGIYGSTGTQLGNQAASAGQQLGQLTQDFYGGLGNLDWNLAQQMGQNVMTGAGAAAGLTGQANAAIGSTVPYAGAGWTAAGNGIGHLEDLGATVLGAQAGRK
jgi:hypothetical protein